MKVRSRSGDLHGLRVSRHPSHPSQQQPALVLQPSAAREQGPVALKQQPTATNFFGNQRIFTANTNEDAGSTIYYMPARKMTAPAKARLNERSSSFLWKTERSSTVVSLSHLLQEKVKVLDRVYEKEMGGLTGNGDFDDELVQPRPKLNLSLLKGQNRRSLTTRRETSKNNGGGGQTERPARKIHIQLVRLCTPHYIEVVGGETRYYRFQAPQNKAIVVMLSFMSVEGMFELYVSEVLQYPSRLECTFNTSISGGNKDIPFSVNTEGKWINLAVFATKTAKFHLIARIEAVEDNFTVSGGVGGGAATEEDEHVPLNPGGEIGRDFDKIGSFAVDKVKLMSALQQKIKMIKMKRRINIVNDAVKRNIEITEKYPEIKSNYFISLRERNKSYTKILVQKKSRDSSSYAIRKDEVERREAKRLERLENGKLQAINQIIWTFTTRWLTLLKTMNSIEGLYRFYFNYRLEGIRMRLIERSVIAIQHQYFSKINRERIKREQQDVKCSLRILVRCCSKRVRRETRNIIFEYFTGTKMSRMLSLKLNKLLKSVCIIQDKWRKFSHYRHGMLLQLNEAWEKNAVLIVMELKKVLPSYDVNVISEKIRNITPFVKLSLMEDYFRQMIKAIVAENVAAKESRRHKLKFGTTEVPNGSTFPTQIKMNELPTQQQETILRTLVNKFKKKSMGRRSSSYLNGKMNAIQQLLTDMNPEETVKNSTTLDLKGKEKHHGYPKLKIDTETMFVMILQAADIDASRLQKIEKEL